MTGFNLAIGLQVANEWVPHFVETYGYLEFQAISRVWVIGPDGIEYFNNDVGLHRCTDDDLPRFNARNSNVPDYTKSLYCLDDTSILNFYGFLGSLEAQMVFINVNRCVDQPHCKDEAEVDEFLKDKLTMVTYN
jgi:hypothetical protein